MDIFFYVCSKCWTARRIQPCPKVACALHRLPGRSILPQCLTCNILCGSQITSCSSDREVHILHKRAVQNPQKVAPVQFQTVTTFYLLCLTINLDLLPSTRVLSSSKPCNPPGHQTAITQRSAVWRALTLAKGGDCQQLVYLAQIPGALWPHLENHGRSSSA